MKECCETGEAKKKRYWHWVVLGLVALLAGGLQLSSSPIDFQSSYQSRRVRNMADIVAVAHALEDYAANNKGAYPSSLQPLVTPDTNGYAYLEGYDGKLPKDSWKHEYKYEPPTPEHPKPRVWSYGADGKRGGTGENADIDSDLRAEW